MAARRAMIVVTLRSFIQSSLRWWCLNEGAYHHTPTPTCEHLPARQNGLLYTPPVTTTRGLMNATRAAVLRDPAVPEGISIFAAGLRTFEIVMVRPVARFVLCVRPPGA